MCGTWIGSISMDREHLLNLIRRRFECHQGFHSSRCLQSLCSFRSNCESQSPAGSEASPSTAAAAAPELGAGASEQAPAPAPGSSGSSTLPISVGSLLIGLVIATSSSWF
nr:uncharacterized protein LOC125424156 [Ziziphus jujuba var. spinosa]